METFFAFFVSFVSKTNYLCRVEEKIDTLLKQVRDLFMRYGLKSVTMDDLCRELGISKKTLYQFVNDKNDLVLKAMEHEIDKDECDIQKILDLNLSAIDELFEITNTVKEKLKNLHPSILYDMQKYYPEAWDIMSKHRNGFIVKTIGDNILKGQKEGVYRQNIHVQIVAALYASKVELLADNMLFQHLNAEPSEIYYENLIYHLHGISNSQGLKALEEKLHPKTQPNEK